MARSNSCPSYRDLHRARPSASPTTAPIILGNCWGPGGSNVKPTLWIDGQPIGLRNLLLANGIPPSVANQIFVTSPSADGMFIGGWWDALGVPGIPNRPILIQIPAPWGFAVLAAAGLATVRR